MGDTAGGFAVYSTQGGEPLASWAPRKPTRQVVTALGAMPVRRNETVLLVGRADGTAESVMMSETVVKPDPYAGRSEPEYSLELREMDLLVHEMGATRGGSVSHIETSRFNAHRFYFLAAGQHVWVFDDTTGNRTRLDAGNPVLGLKSAGPNLYVTTTAGVSNLKLSGMHLGPMPMEGLNGSSLVSAGFDAQVNSKLYALTDEGEVLTAYINSRTAERRCEVRSRQPFGVRPPASISSVRGYVLLGLRDTVEVYNVSGRARTTPAKVFGEPLRHLPGHLGLDSPLPEAPVGAQVDLGGGDPSPPFQGLATNGKRLVAVHLSDEEVGLFASELPTVKPRDFQAKKWTQPIFVIAMLIVGFWQYSRQARQMEEQMELRGGGRRKKGLRGFSGVSPGMHGLSGLGEGASREDIVAEVNRLMQQRGRDRGGAPGKKDL